MKILVTAPYNKGAINYLEENIGQVIYRPWKPHGRAYNEKELLELLEETGANALITEHDDVSSTVIRKNPALEFIGVCRGTPSNVCLKTAESLGIPVYNTPARNAQAVAEMFLANVITLLRNTLSGIDWLEKGNWNKGAHTSYLHFKGNELAGKTIGMVGFGAIGQRIADMVKGFPCYIKYYDPFVDGEFSGCEKVSLEEVFEISDIVSIHLPVNDQTLRMIDRNLLNKMKKSALFVNTSRASVVNREDLLSAIESRDIRGAYLDVFDHEPPDELDYRLILHPNVLATPHIAGATHEVEDHHARIMNQKLNEVFALNSNQSSIAKKS
ncbi:2-hydroxyacid dehydrogenase [Echinicola sediminis]